jgi:hypothetical protein
MRYRNDPKWISAKFVSQCKKCNRSIKKGEDIFWYPSTKSVYCNDSNCGQACSKDFTNSVELEDNGYYVFN